MLISASQHPRCDVLGVKVSAVDLKSAVAIADRWISAGQPGYVCVTGVHGVMEAQSDPELLSTMSRAVLNVPDGMPLTWVGRIQGFAEMDRVFGPDFMMALCRVAAQQGYRVFLYGGKPGVAEELRTALVRGVPDLQIVGTYTPPFGPLNQQQEEDVLTRIYRARPHIVWVGISTPRQERFMAQYFERLQVPLMVGVGAAFDFHTGRIRDCAPWIKRAGLQWVHRMMQEPRRLWRRYLINNPKFLWLVARQLMQMRYNRATAISPPKPDERLI